MISVEKCCISYWHISIISINCYNGAFLLCLSQKNIASFVVLCFFLFYFLFEQEAIWKEKFYKTYFLSHHICKISSIFFFISHHHHIKMKQQSWQKREIRAWKFFFFTLHSLFPAYRRHRCRILFHLPNDIHLRFSFLCSKDFMRKKDVRFFSYVHKVFDKKENGWKRNKKIWSKAAF